MRLFQKYGFPSHTKSAGKKEKTTFRASSSISSNSASTAPSSPSYPSPRFDLTERITLPILSRILSYVCPHVLDDSYESSEESVTEDGCMLCDMRDLAHCALVSKKWCTAAQLLLSVYLLFFLPKFPVAAWSS